jgi:hypothetical protein
MRIISCKYNHTQQIVEPHAKQPHRISSIARIFRQCCHIMVNDLLSICCQKGDMYEKNYIDSSRVGCIKSDDARQPTDARQLD